MLLACLSACWVSYTVSFYVSSWMVAIPCCVLQSSPISLDLLSAGGPKRLKLENGEYAFQPVNVAQLLRQKETTNSRCCGGLSKSDCCTAMSK